MKLARYSDKIVLIKVYLQMNSEVEKQQIKSPGPNWMVTSGVYTEAGDQDSASFERYESILPLRVTGG